jgi:transcription antitermination factor NusA-like protein
MDAGRVVRGRVGRGVLFWLRSATSWDVSDTIRGEFIDIIEWTDDSPA